MNIARPIYWLAGLMLAFAPEVSAIADDAEPPPTPSATQLFEGLLAEESQIDSVHSLYLRFNRSWTQPPELIEKRLADWKAENPGQELDVSRYTSFWPKVTETYELAFDEKRVRKRFHRNGDFRDLCVFDGRSGSKHSKSYIDKRDDRKSGLTLEQLFPQDIFSTLTWPRMRHRQLWFMKDRQPDRFALQYGQSKDYSLGKPAEYRGRQCYVLENYNERLRLYVGAEDRHLYGIVNLMMPKGVDRLSAASKAAGTTFDSLAEFGSWQAGLSDDERGKFAQRLRAQQFAPLRPAIEWYLDSYRELAPGFWFPARQGDVATEASSVNPTLLTRTEIRLVEAKVNAPLDDSLFTLEGDNAAK